MKNKFALALSVACVWGVTTALSGAAFAVEMPAPSGSEGRWSDFATREGDEIAFVDALTAITDKASRDLFGVPVDREAMRREIRALAWKARSGIILGGPEETAEAMRHAFFVADTFVGDPDMGAAAKPETAVLSSVLKNRYGVCLSLSLLYLAVADEARLPLHGVSVPLHFFVRYDDGKEWLNLETLKRGSAKHSDAFYRRKFLVRKGEPFYLQNLTPKMSLACYLSQLGAIYTRLGKIDQAIELLEVARTASPTDPEIRTNLGIALARAGRADEAAEAWQTAVVLDPYDDVAHFGLASAHASRENWLPAIYHFDESLRLGHELDVQLLRRLEPHRPDALYEARSR